MSERKMLVLPGGPGVELAVAAADSASPRTARWRCIRPIDLTKTHGMNFTTEVLGRIAAAYDTAVHVASLNFDHQWGGPSHGRIASVEIDEEGWLVANLTHLSDEAIAGVRSGQWFRLSVEVSVDHPATDTEYLTGLALLGNAEPGVWGQDPLALQRKERRMSTPAAAPAATTTTAPDAGAVAAIAQQAELELAAARRAREQSEALLLSTRRAEATGRITAALAACKGLNKGALDAGLAAALVELDVAAQPASVKLDRNGAEADVRVVDVLLAALAALPDLAALTGGAGQLAAAGLTTPAVVADTRSEDLKRFQRSQGLTDENYLKQLARAAEVN